MTVAAYWERYLAANNLKPEEVTFSGELAFENTSSVGSEQLAMLLSGKKTASFSAFDAYAINREPLPVVGELYVVVDKAEEPCCIIELVDVQVLPFNAVTWEMAQKEGEDESLSAWQDKQREYLQEEADICGFPFTDDARVVFEAFRVIYR